MNGLARAVASGLGVGRFPVAPGTAGSLLGLLLGAVLLRLAPAALPVAAALVAAGGIAAIAGAGAKDDPGWVVIDEVAGQLVAMLPLHRLAWPGLLAAFILFRLFDVTKPGPIGWLDRRHAAWAVMADDLAAGALAAAVLLLAWLAGVRV